eukprot:scaffold521522_cov48-Prasinocladus_malaysianus.AAC.1
MELLLQNGYTNVVEVRGGYEAWTQTHRIGSVASILELTARSARSKCYEWGFEGEALTRLISTTVANRDLKRCNQNMWREF